MNRITDLIALCVTKGIAFGDALEIARFVEEGLSLPSAPSPAAVPAALEKRRAYDRERKAGKRNSGGKSGGKSGGQDDDKSGGNPVDIPPEKASLACVVDNSLPIEIYSKTLSLSHVRDAAGDALASMATHAGLATLAPLTGLLTGAQPCTQSEVLDGIAKAAAWYRSKRPPGSMTNWDLARKMALELRDARLAGTPEPKAPHEQPSPHRPNAFTDHQRSRADANFAGAALALARRRRSGGDEPQGPDSGGPPSLTLISGGGA